MDAARRLISAFPPANLTKEPRMTSQPLDLDAIEAKAAELRQKIDKKNPWPHDNESYWTAEGWKTGTRNALDKLHVEALLAEVRRLRAELDAALAKHKPRTERHGSGCVQCGTVWPCATYRELNAAAAPSA